MTDTSRSGSQTFDIAAIVRSPFDDQGWFSKVLIMGLMVMIPIAGAWNLIGWAREIYVRRKAGDTLLPEASLNYIGDGAVIFFALALSGLPVAVLVAILGVGTSIVGLDALGAVLSLPLYLAYSAVLPAVLFLAMRERDVLAGFRFAELARVITGKGVAAYALFAVSVLLISMFSEVGIFALCVGFFLTMPLAAAFLGAAVQQFEG